MDTNTLLRSLPKVDELLKREDVAALDATHGRPLTLEALREALDATRAAVRAGEIVEVSADAIAADAVAWLALKARRSLRRVINATGIVVHTNLGRSPLAETAIEAVAEVARGYSTLEYDVPSGQRGSRHVHVEDLICRLTGAEAAMAVNNNASAVLLGLAALARRKEAIVSRGQLVEIGGSFRIPDIMRESGAKMVEIGTTNKTHLRDYKNAITSRTGLMLKVHTSNYRVVGFTEEVSLEDLVALGAEHGVPVFEDQGSGVLIDLARFGLPGEPTIGAAVAAGADLVSASGDKLLGGPQAGILAGKRDVIAKLKKHPLARAVRLDKMTLAALEVTLRLYLDERRLFAEVPTLRMLTMTQAKLERRARRLADAIVSACGEAFDVVTAADTSRAGGGALPMKDIPTTVVALAPHRGSATSLEERLRLGEPAVIARIKDDRLLLDPRTLREDEDPEVASALARAARA
ncbi:L-seryl-tRNA(Sec) selenium transferase [Anaerosoma tenue]|uniref:L-seryl-tRNA(Sec) selenium transferase n=1 Tax=Anaerosoma tenue TaxID=2933588 RepID=UPI002260F164|nr:L-seryl-tRNA(Sec) selenium transferase [Anaerosoma tenue]MCK8115905.1 L-seryl-tRNA(Sec) selenium transferase [Anaerosoma tenue]